MAKQSNNNLMIGLDLGTTSAKALAMDKDGNVVGKYQREVELLLPKPGWATQSPKEYALAVDKVLNQLDKKIDIKKAAGISVSGAMHSIIPVDEDNKPLAEGMTWADKRGSKQLKNLQENVDSAALHKKTGCPLRSMYHLPRLRWWTKNKHIESALYANKDVGHRKIRQTTRFVSMKEWIIFRLTGKWACDRGFASTTGLLDLQTRNWDSKAIKLAGINKNQLSPLVDCKTILEPEASAKNPFYNLPVIAGSTDGPLANLGAAGGAGGQSGSIVLTVGTSAAIRKTTNQISLDNSQQGWCYIIGDNLYAQGGAINSGGMTAKWITDLCYKNLNDESKRFNVMTSEAGKVPIGANGITMLPYLSGERTPVWEADASASIYGLKRRHTRGDLSRAALEAVAFCLKDVWQIVIEGALEKNQSPPTTAYITGGITNSKIWCQIVADCLGITIYPCKVADSSAIGAARLGHWAVGNIKNLKDYPAQPCDNPLRPNAKRNEQYAKVYHRFKQHKKEQGYL